MPKIYLDKNVYEAALDRLDLIFSHFSHVYFSVSGGKDSSIMLQLAAQQAKKAGCRFDVLYIDLEAQYQATISHIHELIDCTKDVVNNWYWIALPISLRNAVSAISPKWTCWDKKEREKWVRPLPERTDICLITEDTLPDGWDWFVCGMEFEEFILCFAKWYTQYHNGPAAAGIGIRSDESLNRFRTIISADKERFLDFGWTTRVKIHDKPTDCFNFYPLYDWSASDDWTAIARYDLKFNRIYELMYKNGMSIYEQRLCQPYGDDQRKSLNQFRYLEPETWEKVLLRVEGVNFGNIYCRTSLLGNIRSEKPADMTWEQYAVFLLESLGLYAPEVRDHYYRKIKKFMIWWEKEIGITSSDMPDEKWDLPGYRQSPYWKRVARAVEKNDFWMTSLSFSETKGDVKRLMELKKKYAFLICRDIDTTNTKLRQAAARIEDELTKA